MSQFGDNLSSRAALPGIDSDRLSAMHLTDEQFTELLLGATSPSISAHLKVCGQCSAEAERVSGAIGSFEEQSRLWAERETAARPRIQARRPAFAWFRPSWLRPAPAWAAAAATVALVFGLVFHGASGRSDRSSQPQPAIAAVTAQPSVTLATLQSDNALLAAIDGELRTEDAPSANAYGLDLGVRTVHARPGKRVRN
jgi:hypothetical protein